MYITKKIEIHFTKAQQAKALEILYLLTKLWNDYIETQYISLSNECGWINRYDFDKNFYSRLKYTNPDYQKIPSKARQDMFAVCAKYAVKVGFKKLKYRSIKNDMIRSFFFARVGIRLVDPSHLWISNFYTVKLKETGYLKESDVPLITSGRIIYDSPVKKWYIALSIDYPESEIIKTGVAHDQPAMGIDVGIKTYITAAYTEENTRFSNGPVLFDGNIRNPAMDTFSKNCFKKMNHIQSILAKKQHATMIKIGYAPKSRFKDIKQEDSDTISQTSRVKKLRDRLLKIQRRAINHKYDALKKMCKRIASDGHKWLVVEELDASDLMRGDKRNLRRIDAQCCFYYFRWFLQWECVKHQTPLISAPRSFPSTQRCSCCGSLAPTFLKLSDRYFRCDTCGYLVDRDVNAAQNLLAFSEMVISGEVQL